MMKRCSNLFVCVLLMGFVSGCQDQTAVVGSGGPIQPTPVVNEKTKVTEVVQEDEENPETGGLVIGGLLDMAKKLHEGASDSGSENADKAKKWMNDKFGDATDSGSQVADDAAKWASDAFDSLKDQGLTSADSAKEWLTEDIRNMNALKYKIVTVSLDDIEAAEDELNRLGNLRWECFHAVQRGEETVLFFKKERRSVLKNIPVKDLMRLIPLMGSEGE